MRDDNEVACGQDEEAEYYAIRPNKSQIKRDIAKITRIAEELIQLSDLQLVAMELAANIENAIVDAKKMSPTKPARKRQLKFITAQLKLIELNTVIESLDRLKTKSAYGVREYHQAEQWRDKLMTEDSNDALTEFLKQFPSADRQHLRQLQRNAQKEAKAEKPPKSARILHKYLKELIFHSNQSIC